MKTTKNADGSFTVKLEAATYVNKKTAALQKEPTNAEGWVMRGDGRLSHSVDPQFLVGLGEISRKEHAIRQILAHEVPHILAEERARGEKGCKNRALARVASIVKFEI